MRRVAAEAHGTGPEPTGRYERQRDNAAGRSLAGTVAGGLVLVSGLTMAAYIVVVGGPTSGVVATLVLSGVAAIWGVVCMTVIDWRRSTVRLLHVTGVGALAVIVGTAAASGGASSPVWLYLVFILVFASYFHQARVGAIYVLLCVCAVALPVAYDPAARQTEFLGQLVITLPTFVGLGVAVIAGKALLSRQRARAERVASEQAALRHVAVAVAGGASPASVYALVAEEIGRVAGANGAGVLRLDRDSGDLVVLGTWHAPGARSYEPGMRVLVRPGSDVAEAIEQGRVVRIARHEQGSPVHRLGYMASIVAPVTVQGEIWGLLAVAHDEELGVESEARMREFGSLLTTAIVASEDRALLARQASTDPLTGLENHRAFHEKVAVEVARAIRHERPLAVAVIDVDRFKQVNDVLGHAAGDRLLVRVSEVLRSLSRREDVLGRIGGDEFAWLFCEADAAEAFAALERARLQLARNGSGMAAFSISAGIADMAMAVDPVRLMALADGALYWSKAHGRNACCIYDPDVVADATEHERAERLERTSALLGLRALARAIDAKDPITRRHSERVSELVGRLARQRGWSEARASLLEEAALVHDVGKIGVPDAVLLKPGPLSAAEQTLIMQHAELGARIVGDVLAEEQVGWIRAHHERPDGRGYPLGLPAETIPEGATLLAVADAWDVMTCSRPYATPKSPARALAEARALVGRQFTADAVAALAELYEAGELAAPVQDGDGRGDGEGEDEVALDATASPPAVA